MGTTNLSVFYVDVQRPCPWKRTAELTWIHSMGNEHAPAPWKAAWTWT
jgi:hypothetical protein